MFSPRVALILKPMPDHAIRVSYNKAFRSPSLINNFLDTTIVNQVNLGAINPALNGVVYNFPVRAVGNQDLVEESTESFELGYTGIIKKRATVSAAVYWTTNKDEIFFTQTGRYRADARRRRAGRCRRWSSRCCRRPARRADLHDAAACRRSSATATSARTRTRASSSASTARSTRR